jgi:hypothetical protein
LIASQFKDSVARDPNLDLVAFFEIQRFDYCGGQPHR